MRGLNKLEPSILFEDPHLIVLSKPAGLLSQGEHRGAANLVDWLRQYLGRHYVGLVHRLDRNTSGLMVVAKRSKSAARLTQCLQEGLLQRRYLAWLCGRLEKPVRWQHWLAKDEKKNRVTVYRHPHVAAKEAVLSAVPVRYTAFKNTTLTLAQLTLETGRSHQIRAQAACEGFPVLGDSKYGGAPCAQKKFSRPALHSAFLEFPHPMTDKIMTFREDFPIEIKGSG